jgi:hypothetical protein
MGKKYEFVSEPKRKTWRRRDNLERRIHVGGVFGKALFLTVHSSDNISDHTLLEELARKGFRITVEENN